MRKVFVASACRTAIGSFGGSLSHLSPQELGTICARAALERAFGSGPIHVDEVIVGNVLGAGHGMNVARQIALKSGLSAATSAFTVNKVCGSGLKAVALGASAIMCGESECVLAGGVESMSQAGFVSLQARWGSRLGHSELKDIILQDGLTDFFGGCHMGVTAENLAKRYDISRLEQDEFALESQQRAARAIAAGDFLEEIVPIPLYKKGVQVGVYDKDEYPRPDTSVDALSKLKPAFQAGGTVTAGNASGINDGAAMVVLVSEGRARELGLLGAGSSSLPEILGFASGGVEPEVMGLGPVEAVKKLVTRTGTELSSVDIVESNEAFAAQAIAVNRAMGWDLGKVNPQGGAIALGHPIGASGARI